PEQLAELEPRLRFITSPLGIAIGQGVPLVAFGVLMSLVVAVFFRRSGLAAVPPPAARKRIVGSPAREERREITPNRTPPRPASSHRTAWARMPARHPPPARGPGFQAFPQNPSVARYGARDWGVVSSSHFSMASTPPTASLPLASGRPPPEKNCSDSS